MLGGLDLGQHGVQYIGCIAHDGKIHIHVLAQLAGVNIDLDDGGVFGKGLGVQRHAVGKAGTHRDVETGEKYRIGYITQGVTERIKLERGKWYKVAGGGNLTLNPVNIRVE